MNDAYDYDFFSFEELFAENSLQIRLQQEEKRLVDLLDQVHVQQRLNGFSHGAPPMDMTVKSEKKPACTHCYNSKVACDGQRPCSRCIKGLRDCTDRTALKRGRSAKH
jgi:hypothetical protein